MARCECDGAILKPRMGLGFRVLTSMGGRERRSAKFMVERIQTVITIMIRLMLLVGSIWISRVVGVVVE